MKTLTRIITITSVCITGAFAQDRGARGVVPEFVLFVSPVTPSAVWSGNQSVATTERLVPLEFIAPFKPKVFSALYE